MNTQQAKKISIINYLENLGYMPQKWQSGEALYFSPIRDESTASFRATIDKWFDFGLGCGGNIIDLAMQFIGCNDVSMALSHIENAMQGQSIIIQLKAQQKQSKVEIVKVGSLENASLLNYAKSRGISNVIAKRYCQEANYKVGDKDFYAIAFKNDANGYELRNKYFKGCTSKSITYIDKGFNAVGIFEGFFDFLTWMEMCEGEKSYPFNILILNSTSNFEKSLPIVMKNGLLLLFLDADKTGKATFKKYQELGKMIFDYSFLYDGKCNDLNELWVKEKELEVIKNN